MRLRLNSVHISVKLLFTSVAFILFFSLITAVAYFGFSHQKAQLTEFFDVRYKKLARLSDMATALASVHGTVSRTFHSPALSDAERSRNLQTQFEALRALVRSVRQSAESERVGERKKRIEALLPPLERYQKLIEQALMIRKPEARTVQRILAAADDLFLESTDLFQSVHSGDDKLGAMVFEQIRKTYLNLPATLVVLFVAAVCFTIVINLFLFKRTIVEPIKRMEEAAVRVSKGDLDFDPKTGSSDEIGRAGELLKVSFAELENVLHRIKELSDRILKVVADVEEKSEKVLVGAEAQANATSTVSASILELNTTVDEIAGNTEGLADSSETASASIEQMASSIKSIDTSIQELNGLVASSTVSIGQLSNAVRDIARHSAELETASEETTTAMALIAASVRDVETHAKESAAVSEQVTSEAATLGLEAMLRTIKGMEEISSMVHAAAESIQTLDKRSKEIEMIVQVIEAVNDETNLLALNASILAAQAGEHGKGFAVVARKIKDLSSKTEQSTKEIAALITTVQKEMNHAGSTILKGIPAVEEGSRLAKAGEEALRRIVESSKRASEMAISIQRSTEQQAASSALVEEAAQRVKKMVGRIVKATTDQSDEVSRITEAAERMKNLSGRVSKATGEQATSSEQISRTTQSVSERSHQIAKALNEHRVATRGILSSLETVENIPRENQDLAFRISKTLWNLQKDVELLGAEMERFSFHDTGRQSIRFGVVPLKEPSEMYRKFKPLSDYLAGAIGRKVDLKVAIDMESAVKDLGENVTHICAMGPANYVEARRAYGVDVIVKALRKGRPFHQVAVVVRDDSPITSLSDLAGRRFAFGNIASATGHIIPLSMLRNVGIPTEQLAHYDFLGHHEDLIKAVLGKEFDAACVIDEVAEKNRERGLRVLAHSIDIPEFNISCHPSLDPGIRNRIRQMLTALSRTTVKDAKILQSLGKDCTGFVAAGDEDYAGIREAILNVSDLVAAQVEATPVQKGWS